MSHLMEDDELMRRLEAVKLIINNQEEDSR